MPSSRARPCYPLLVPFRVFTLAERPDLAEGFRDADFARAAPAFLRHDPLAPLYFGPGRLEHHHAFALVAVDEAAPNSVIARAASVPFAFGPGCGVAGREQLPSGGWDTVIRWADEDRLLGRRPTAVSTLEISIRPERQGQALAALLLRALRDNAQAQGFGVLYAPVRPAEKDLEPRVPMRDYAARLRPEDGLPTDSRLRVHVRLGGEIVGVAPYSMTVPGTLAEWRGWTGLPFDVSGELIVPGALAPVHVSVEQDCAVYVEPGVWLRHRL